MGEVQTVVGDAKGVGVVVAVEPREVVETEESYADEQQGNRFCNRYMSVQVRGHLSFFCQCVSSSLWRLLVIRLR